MSAIWKRPDGTVIETEKQFITELNTLLARAEKAEAAFESAQKMCDHWEKKAAERQGQANEWKARAEKAEVDRDQWKRSAKAFFADFELGQKKNSINPIDWQRVRIDAAIAAMHGGLVSREPVDKDDERELVCCSARCADALVAELQKKEVEK